MKINKIHGRVMKNLYFRRVFLHNSSILCMKTHMPIQHISRMGIFSRNISHDKKMLIKFWKDYPWDLDEV